MKTRDLLKLSWLEISRYKSVSLFLVLNLTLGLIGFFLLQIFQQSLVLQSSQRAQATLGGDIAISAQRPLTEQERKVWESEFPAVKSSHFYKIFSMMRAKDNSKLVNVGAFDDNYPLYGEFKLSDGGFDSDSPKVWTDPEVQDLLGLQLNDEVEIGEEKFIFAGTITEDPTRLFRGVGFAPRVLIHRNFLKAANLLQEGSTLTDNWFYQLPAGTNAEAVMARLEKSIQDPAVRIESSSDNSQDSNRILRYFTDYLGLVALVALGLCFLCGSYLLQWTFLNKKKNIAIYKTLGLSNVRIVVMYLLQNLLVSLLACVLGYFIVQALEPAIQQLITVKFKLPIQLVFSSKAILITCALAVLGPMLMVVPQLIQLVDLKPLTLLQNTQEVFKRKKIYYVWLIVSVLLFWFLSVKQSNSFRIASIFTGSLVGMVVFFQVMNRVVLYALDKFSGSWPWLMKHATRGLTRKASSTGLVFTTMGLATLVLSLLPHIKTSIISEIRPENTSQMPSLFMFDIQPEQTAGIAQMAKDMLQQDVRMNPLVRSRILKINDQDYERTLTNENRTREEDEEARFRNRGVNLTYRDHLQDSETVVEGVFSGKAPPEGLPGISLEKEYAKRVHVKVGDVMTFDIQGIELKAQVSSLRQVRWTSFQPNFFILFPSGVLEDAPQIFLTSVTGDQKALLRGFQTAVSSRFKNVSVIDLRATIENSMKYIDQMSIGLQFMAWLAVLVGIFVFVVLLNTQIRERLQEMNLLQILGASGNQIVKVVLMQFSVLMACSISFGVLSGLAMAWVLIHYFFNVQTVYDIRYLFLLAAVLLPVCGLALYAGLKPLKKLNPMDLIRQM